MTVTSVAYDAVVVVVVVGLYVVIEYVGLV